MHFEVHLASPGWTPVLGPLVGEADLWAGWCGVTSGIRSLDEKVSRADARPLAPAPGCFMPRGDETGKNKTPNQCARSEGGQGTGWRPLLGFVWAGKGPPWDQERQPSACSNPGAVSLVSPAVMKRGREARGQCRPWSTPRRVQSLGVKGTPVGK